MQRDSPALRLGPGSLHRHRSNYLALPLRRLPRLHHGSAGISAHRFLDCAASSKYPCAAAIVFTARSARIERALSIRMLDATRLVEPGTSSFYLHASFEYAIAFLGVSIQLSKMTTWAAFKILA